MRVPDLLYSQPYLSVDRRALEEILGLAFMGRELGTQLHDRLAQARIPPRERLRRRALERVAASTSTTAPATETSPDGSFHPDFFSADLFVETLVKQSFRISLRGRSYPVNAEFLQRVLEHAPVDRQTIEMRQAVLRELDERPELSDRLEDLYVELFDLMSLMKTPGFSGSLDLAAFRLDILRQLRSVIDRMADDFADAESALHRLHTVAIQTQQDEPYGLLRDLLEYESGLAQLGLDVTVGADGSLRSFSVRSLQENDRNRFYRTPWKRLGDRIRLAFRGYGQSRRELMNRLVNEVFRRLADPMVPYVQLLGHLEFYLASRAFRSEAEGRGLAVCLPEMVEPGTAGLRLVQCFNPLLLQDPIPPTPAHLETQPETAVVLITGPNSGGKTRLLQALGLVQLLAQSGSYVPCREARLVRQSGLFVSLIEEEGARATEGRLGRELVRIRSLFERMAPHSLVVLDELCSGTNPSEGIEVFTMVLELLREVQPTAFVTTHFLDYARSLQEQPVIDGLEFRQVEVDDELRSTYQFVEGVAATSLAAVTAQRLGVTFDRLADTIRRRGDDRMDDQ